MSLSNLNADQVIEQFESALLVFSATDSNGNVIEDSISLGVSDDQKKINYQDTMYTGMELLVKLIVEHIVDNIKTSLLERFDMLESDFDTFVNTMSTVGVADATNVPAGVTSFLLTSNTGLRTVKKSAAETDETGNILYGRI